jgi:hypothetical protein
MPIIPTRRGLRVLNFTELDGAGFVSVVWKAAETALGKRRIVPLKRVEGDLVSNSWEEHPMAERTSQNWKDRRERTLEELLQLPPDELLAALREEALHADNIWLLPKDDPLFQEISQEWLIFTLPRFDHSKDDTTDGSEDSET